MTKFKVLVILTLDFSNLHEKVNEMLSPYYSELEVEAYREYLNQSDIDKEIKYLLGLSKEEINKLAIEYEVASNDLEAIAKINLDWHEEDIVGFDEHGYYRMTTVNPQGKWDWYSIIETEYIDSDVLIKYPCRVINLPNLVPYALVTPDGHWYEAGEQVGIQAFKRFRLHQNLPITEEEINWDLQVKKILACYPNYFAVALNCHI